MKKFLYIAFVIMIGTSVFMNAQTQQTRRRALNMTEEASKIDDFVTINQLYTWIHNEDYIARVQSTQGFEVILFESVVTHTVDRLNTVVPTITFIIRNIETLPGAVGTNVTSQAGVRLYDEENYFDIPFVNIDGNTNASPSFVDLTRRRNFFDMLNSVGLMHFSVRTYDILDEITQITNIVLLDGQGRVVPLNDPTNRIIPSSDIKDSDFFDQVNGLKSSLEDETSNSARDAITRNWLEDNGITRNPLENDDWHLGFASIMTSGMWVRIFLELGVYVLIFALLGYLLFRKKKNPNQKTPNQKAPIRNKPSQKIRF